MLITLSRAAFIAAASVVQAKQDIRYYLNGILIEKAPKSDGKDNGLLIVATDGHRLVAAHDENAEFSSSMPDSLIVQFGAESLRSIRLAKSLDKSVALEVSDADVFVSVGESCFQDSKLIDGKFPDWRKVVADRGGNPTGWYNAAYIADFETVAHHLDRFRGKKERSITIRADDALSSAIIYFGGIDYAFGMLMPMREDVDIPSLPAWAVGPFKKAA